MSWDSKVKKHFDKSLGTISKGVEEIGSLVGHVTANTTSSIGHSVEHAVDRLTDQTHSMVESKVEQTLQQVQGRIYQEVSRAAPGALLLGVGIMVAAISCLLFSFFIINVLTDIVHLPSWVAYLMLSILLGTVSLVLIQQGRKRLFP